MLTDAQIEQFLSPRRLGIEGLTNTNTRRRARLVIKHFFANYAISQNIFEAVSESVISQFLDPLTTDERRKELGNLMLGEAIRVAVDPLEPLHKELRGVTEIHTHRRTEPEHVVRKFFSNQDYPNYLEPLKEKLAS